MSFLQNNAIKNSIFESKVDELNLKNGDKYQRIHHKNSKNLTMNNKENHFKNNAILDNNELGYKNDSTEVYNLNQYWSAANLNAFGSQNFSLPKNMILGKNRSRDTTGFGSPTLRKIDLEKEKSKDAFDSIMAKHGLLKDLNNLNSFNVFWKQSPLRHQRSLDYWYQSTNSSLYPSNGQDPTHLKTWTQQNLNLFSRKENNRTPGSINSQFSPIGTLQTPNEMGGRTMDSNTPGYSFPFQRRARSASPPKDPEINEKIAATLSPRHHKEKNTSAVDDLLEDQIMGLQDPLKSQKSIHSRIGSGSFKSRKPIVANTNLFFIGGSGRLSNRGSHSNDIQGIDSNKMKVLSKAINHYLHGEYNKIVDEQPDNKLIENDLCTHDLKGHDISDGNEHDLTDEGVTKKWEVDDWLQEADNSGPIDNSVEEKHQDGFDPFTQPKPDNYQSRRSVDKNRKNHKAENEDGMSNENIMQIIQNSQKQTENEKSSKNNQKYVSLTEKEEEVVEKNIIVDDADFELENWLEGEEWMFKTFNTKKKLEAKKALEEAEKERAKLESCPKPPSQSISANKRLETFKEPSKNDDNSDPESHQNKLKRRRKNSKHRRTESKTFDKDFLLSMAESLPS